MSDTESGNGGMSSVTGFVLGAVVGAGLALLLAPAKGGDTRKKLGQTARRIRSRASDMMSHGEDEPATGGQTLPR